MVVRPTAPALPTQLRLTGPPVPEADAGRPALCDNLPKLPVTYKVKRGPKGSEDFTFDREGNLISVDNASGNLYKTPFSGPPKLVASTRFMDAAALCPDDLETEYLYTAEGKNLRFSWLDPDERFEVVMVYTKR